MQETRVVEHGKELEEYNKLCEYTNAILRDFNVETATRNDIYDLAYAKLKLDEFQHSGLHNSIIDGAVERTRGNVSLVLNMTKNNADIYTRDIDKAKSKSVNKKKGTQLQMQNTGSPTVASCDSAIKKVMAQKMIGPMVFGGIMLFVGNIDSILKMFGLNIALPSKSGAAAAAETMSNALKFGLSMMSTLGMLVCTLTLAFDILYITIPAFRLMMDARAENNSGNYVLVSHEAVAAVRECEAGVIISCNDIYSPDRVEYGRNILKALVTDTSYIKKIGKNKAVYERAQSGLTKELGKFGKERFDTALINRIYNISVDLNSQVMSLKQTVDSSKTSEFEKIEALAKAEMLVESRRDTVSLINKMHSLIETNAV